MALPGKLCIGIIEEDNPQKSYFRFKPILVAEGEGYVAYDVANEYPEHGCIRIVPDKNESSRFKARMRRMGRYCMVDLRDHPDENDKIRPNKNYRGDDIESNAYIIYSDVVREVPDGMIADVISQDVPADSAQLALNLPAPVTSRVVFSGFSPFGALWSHAPIPSMDEGTAFTKTDAVADESAVQRFTLSGFGENDLDFIIARPESVLFTPEAPAALIQAAPAAPEAPAHEPKPAPAPAPAAPAPRPWLHHDESIVPPPVDPRLSPREQAMALQTGINPRRGRSLQEIIEDKWRRSRFDQLGHPVPGAVMGRPVTSPVDAALEAVRSAWSHINARAGLAQALAGIDGLSVAITGSESASVAEERARQLAEYDQARNELAAEIARCRAEHDKLHGEMLKELQEKHASELAEHSKRVHQLEDQEAALRARADEAQRVASEAEQAIARLTDEKLTARLSEYAVNTRAASLLVGLSGGRVQPCAAPAEVSSIDNITIPALARRVREHFAANGHAITDNDAINLLACFTLGDKLLLTGPAGCGKTRTAQLLVEALGITAAGRSAAYTPAKDGPCALPFGNDACALPAVIIADDINAADWPPERIVSDFESAAGIKVIMTAQDSASGRPIGLRLLDRSFMVRLRAESADSPWTGPTAPAAAPEGCVTIAALKKLFAPEARHISAQVAGRLSALRKELAGFGATLSRRTLDALWQYCAAITPYMSLTPLEVFDLAFSQRALPAVISGAHPEALHALNAILNGMPRCQELLKQPVAIEL